MRGTERKETKMTRRDYIRYLCQLRTGREAIAKWLSEQMNEELDDTKKWLEKLRNAPIERALKMFNQKAP